MRLTVDRDTLSPRYEALLTAWGHLQHELLYLSWALMDAALLTPFLMGIMSWARYWQPGIVLLWLLWIQLALGLATIPLSAQHLDGSMMMRLAEWGQRIVTFRSGGVELLAGAGWVFKAHMFLGMTVFLIFPFTRLVHVWSGFGTLAYVLRLYQLVRARRLNLPAGHNQPAAK